VLYHQRWRFTSEATSDQHSQKNQHNNDHGALQSKRLRDPPTTCVTEPPAGPRTPPQAHDLPAAFRTKIWTIIREERQSSRIIDNSREKQPIRGANASEISAFEKLRTGGHTLQADFLCVTPNPFIKPFF